MTRRAIVTGGLGYIGGRMSQALATAGWTVRIVSRQARDVGPAWSRDFDLAIPDMDDRTSLASLCRGAELVVHLAAMNEVDAAGDPEGALRVNGNQSLAWLRAALAAGVKRFIFFSTAHVYAAPLVGRLDEATLPAPRHPYAITHLVAEDFVLAAHAAGHINGLVFRLSNAVGAPADANVYRWMLVANDLCRQAVQESKLTLKSNGLQLRDFIAMQDVTRAVAHFATAERGVWADGLFNLGSGRSTSVYDLACLIGSRARAILNRDVPVERMAPSEGEIPAPLDFRIDKLRAAGFSPNGELAQEIDATILLCRDAFGQ